MIKSPYLIPNANPCVRPQKWWHLGLWATGRTARAFQRRYGISASRADWVKTEGKTGVLPAPFNSFIGHAVRKLSPLFEKIFPLRKRISRKRRTNGPRCRPPENAASTNGRRRRRMISRHHQPSAQHKPWKTADTSFCQSDINPITFQRSF